MSDSFISLIEVYWIITLVVLWSLSCLSAGSLFQNRIPFKLYSVEMGRGLL